MYISQNVQMAQMAPYAVIDIIDFILKKARMLSELILLRK